MAFRSDTPGSFLVSFINTQFLSVKTTEEPNIGLLEHPFINSDSQDIA